MGTLVDGIGTLNSGVQEINGKVPELINGITALRDGSEALKDGLHKAMDEGIQKLANLVDEDLDDLTVRLSACIDAAKSYTSFSGKAPEADSTVKFIFKTASIEVPKAK